MAKERHQSEYLLEVRGVAKTFGGLKAVDNVDLKVRRGELVSIIGPNGSGKSTLFDIITGLCEADAGQVMLDGHDITRMPAHRRTESGIARTFQTLRLFWNLSLMDNVLAGAHHRLRTGLLAALVRPPSLRAKEQQIRSHALEILAIFGQRLLPRVDHLVSTLSYANRRRAEIARALASNPLVLLLDEPTAGMNPVETQELTQIIREIRDRGCTIVVIEHKLNVVMDISDWVMVLDHGARITSGSTEEVCKNPQVVEAYLGRRHHNA